MEMTMEQFNQLGGEVSRIINERPEFERADWDYPGFLAIRIDGFYFAFGTANGDVWAGHDDDGEGRDTVSCETGVTSDCRDAEVIALAIINVILGDGLPRLRVRRAMGSL